MAANRFRPPRLSWTPGMFAGARPDALTLVLAVAALVLAVVSHQSRWVEVPRAAAEEAIGPVRAIVGAPLALVRQLSSGLRARLRLEAENTRLREENARLRAWYDLALAMHDKMDRYESLLNMKAEPAVDVVAARVTAESDGPFVRARLINAGAVDGVDLGQAVISDRGVLGRIVAVGRSSSRVLLLSDLNSRLPVMAERHNARAIVAGDNTETPRLAFLERGHGLVNGDRIVTSGDGGVMAPGLIVGEAFADERGDWRVRPYAFAGPVDYVRVIAYPGPDAPEADPLPSPEPDALAADAATGGAGGASR